MIKRLFILIACAMMLQACSWIERFFVVNDTDEAITLDVKLLADPGNFPIFSYRSFYTYPVQKNNVSCEKPTEVTPAHQSGKNQSQYTVTLPAHTALEIGRLDNDKYERYDQYFINDRKFNLESITVKSAGKEISITPATFDAYFKKSRGNIYYYIR